MSDGTTLYCGDNCNHTGPHRYPPNDPRVRCGARVEDGSHVFYPATGEPPPLDVRKIAVLRKALAIGRISWDGDGWYAEDAGYDYDDAELTLSEAAAILAALSTPTAGEPE